MKKIGPKPLLILGFLFLGFSALFQQVITMYVSCFLIRCACVLTWGPPVSKALSSLPHRMAGMASCMFMTLQEIGG